jgi:hypothetical protein
VAAEAQGNRPGDWLIKLQLQRIACIDRRNLVPSATNEVPHLA